jgi:hypothetical protein
VFRRGRVPAVEPPWIKGIADDDPLIGHLDRQIGWFDRNAARSMRWHFRLRLGQILAAAAIPVLQIAGDHVALRVVVGALGGLIVVLQGVDSLHHYGEHHVAWRATERQLSAERWLFSISAGAYQGLPPLDGEARQLLAERVHAIESQEHEQWRSQQLLEGDGRPKK